MNLRLKPCLKCRCYPDKGIVCENIVCEATNCYEDEEQITEPGTCCPKCISKIFLNINITSLVE